MAERIQTHPAITLALQYSNAGMCSIINSRKVVPIEYANKGTSEPTSKALATALVIPAVHRRRQVLRAATGTVAIATRGRHARWHAGKCWSVNKV